MTTTPAFLLNGHNPLTFYIGGRLQRKINMEKLAEPQAAASDSPAGRYTHEEIFVPLREKYGY
jgi:hypothetical protein